MVFLSKKSSDRAKTQRKMKTEKYKELSRIRNGVEVKFYNMEVQLDEHLETLHKGLYVIGDGSGVTHSLSHASASGVFVAREIAEESRC